MRNSILKSAICFKQLLQRFLPRRIKLDISLFPEPENWEALRSCILPKDIKLSSVMDISSATTNAGPYLYAMGPSSLLSIITDPDAFKQAENNRKICNMHNWLIECDDPVLYAFWPNLAVFDTVFALHLADFSRNRQQQFLARLHRHVKNAFYILCPKDSIHNLKQDLLNYTDFTQFELCNLKSDHHELIRCSREILSQVRAAKQLKELLQNNTYKRIAVVGKAASGKSYLRKTLKRYIGSDHSYELFDDHIDRSLLATTPKYVYFVYEALQLVNDFDAVFFCYTDELVRRNVLFQNPLGQFIMKKWFGFRVLPEKHYTNHAPSGNLEAVQALYSVKR